MTRFEVLRDQTGRLAAVKVGFTWWAFLLPPIMLLIHRIWGKGIAYFVAWAFIRGVAREPDLTMGLAWTMLGIHIALAYVAGRNFGKWRRQKLERLGYALVSTLEAPNEHSAKSGWVTA